LAVKNLGGNQSWRAYNTEWRRMRLGLTAQDWAIIDELATEQSWGRNNDKGAVEQILMEYCARKRDAGRWAQLSSTGPEELRR